MSFCCGASMIGTKGTLKHEQTMIHNVPILLCPVCCRVEVHHRVRGEFEILAEFAEDDDVAEMDFQDYVRHERDEVLYTNCVYTDGEEPLASVIAQIDMALDLVLIAGQLQDDDWKKQLFKRLQVLGSRREKLLNRRKPTP